jgi:hypothetical protein
VCVFDFCSVVDRACEMRSLWCVCARGVLLTRNNTFVPATISHQKKEMHLEWKGNNNPLCWPRNLIPQKEKSLETTNQNPVSVRLPIFLALRISPSTHALCGAPLDSCFCVPACFVLSVLAPAS